MRYSKTAPVKIVVLGAGGTGGYVIPHLYRLGYASEHPTRIIVCDGDVVEQKNLIRQNFVAQDIGRNKAQVLAARYAAAFGIECEYRPEFIEMQRELYELTEPDHLPYPMEPQRVILLGCVDNNKSRQLCHRVFEQKRDLIYIDAGNGEHTGQVVCGVRQHGRTLYKPVCSLYPDLLEDEDKFPSELSCAERAVSAPPVGHGQPDGRHGGGVFPLRSADRRRPEDPVCDLFLETHQHEGRSRQAAAEIPKSHGESRVTERRGNNGVVSIV